MSRTQWLLVAISSVVAAAGAIGSVGFMLSSGQHPPRLLLAGFLLWVLSPFAVLLWANKASTRWLPGTRAALQGATLLITLASLAIYGGWVDVRPPGAANAFVFVAVPPASWIFVTVVVLVAALVSRRIG